MAVDIRARLNFRPGAVNRHHGHGRRRRNPWQTLIRLVPTSETLHAEIFLDLQGGGKISDVGARHINMQTYKKLLPGTPRGAGVWLCVCVRIRIRISFISVWTLKTLKQL